MDLFAFTKTPGAGDNSPGLSEEASRLTAGLGRTEPDHQQGWVPPSRATLPPWGLPASHPPSFPLPRDRNRAGAAPHPALLLSYMVLNTLLFTNSLVKNMKE